jgi:2-polyprenyl-6-methoxyphenol hydroxylase-like FAD-dependent oxidoreductase
MFVDTSARLTSRESPVPRSAASVFADIAAFRGPAHQPAVIDRAVVLGGSVAGLLAARILADHAESVLIVDRDGPATVDGARGLVPQGDQVHALLPGGRAHLDRWFPGFTDQAVAGGASRVPAAARRSYLDGRRKVSGSQVDYLSATRPFLEGEIRRHTMELPNVSAITGRVTGLDFDDTAVTAVRYESADGPGRLDADFVVDATGRSSKLSDWLEQGGWERPPMTRMTVNINYATAAFRRPENVPDPVLALAVWGPRTGGDFGGAVFTPVEDNRFLVMFGGYGDCRPGNTTEDLIRRCREDLPPEFAPVVGNEVVSEARTYRHPDSRRRDFAGLTRFPARLVAAGDAVASFNPIYGQGMSSAAMHASALSLYLRAAPDLAAPATDFFALQKVVVDAAWSFSTSADLARPSVPSDGHRTPRIASWLSDQIISASVTDDAVARRFDDVTGMLAHPSSLGAPGTVLRAIRANRRAQKS